MANLDHNRPQLRYSDNLAKLRLILNRQHRTLATANKTPPESPQDCPPSDPKLREEWNVCNAVIDALEEYSSSKTEYISSWLPSKKKSRKANKSGYEKAHANYEYSKEVLSMSIRRFLVNWTVCMATKEGGGLYKKLWRAIQQASKRDPLAGSEIYELFEAENSFINEAFISRFGK